MAQSVRLNAAEQAAKEAEQLHERAPSRFVDSQCRGFQAFSRFGLGGERTRKSPVDKAFGLF